MEFESLKNNVILDLEKAEEKLMHRWVSVPGSGSGNDRTDKLMSLGDQY